jgi:hypothetical protein
MRCNRVVSHTRDKRVFLLEGWLVLGSFVLRFESEIAQVLTVLIGWPSWYLACHLAALTVLWIARTARSEIDDVRLSSL